MRKSKKTDTIRPFTQIMVKKGMSKKIKYFAEYPREPMWKILERILPEYKRLKRKNNGK